MDTGHPVKNLKTGKVEITSQNHSYAVDAQSLTETPLTVTHVNLLDNTVEGLIHISKIPGDYYIFDETNYEIYGEKTKQTFKLGQTVEVVVNDVDFVSNTVDFLQYDEEEE